MTAIQPRNADAFVKKPDPQCAVVLIYGPDTGLVSERARAVIAASVDDPADPFQLVRLEGDTLAEDPGRLIDEAGTVPLFGGRRAIWVKAGGRSFAPALEALLDAPPADCRIVIEGGDWKKSHALVALVEKSRAGAAIACYGDERAAIGQVIADEAAAHGLTLTSEARAALMDLLGGDRLASRGEMQKLCLYAAGAGRIELRDVEAVVGDATNLMTDEIVDAAFGGRPDRLDAALAKAWTENVNPSVLAGTALRHGILLHRLRGEVDKGQAAAAAAVEKAGREIHFKRKAGISAQLVAVTSEHLAKIMEDLSHAVLEARRSAALGPALVSRALMRISLSVRPRS